jgi:hypothetical protein
MNSETQLAESTQEPNWTASILSGGSPEEVPKLSEEERAAIDAALSALLPKWVGPLYGDA